MGPFAHTLLVFHRVLQSVLLPSRFRAEFGEELDAAVRARVASRRGELAASMTGVLELLDLVRTAVREWSSLTMVAAGRMVEGLGSDLHIATRTLSKSPAFTVLSVLTLALGIGVTTATFSVVEGVLLRPLPYSNPDRIVTVAIGLRPESGRTQGEFSDRGYWHFARENEAFEAFGALEADPIELTLTGDGPAMRVEVAGLSRSAMQVLGVPPQLGRLFSPAEDGPGGQATVALISARLWADRFRSEPGVLGRRLVLSGIEFEIVGVMPGGYDFPSPTTDVWLPRRLNPASDNVGNHHLAVVARLRPDVTLEDAVEDGRGLVARLGEAGYGPEWFEGIFDGGVIVRPLRDAIVGEAAAPLWIAFATVMVVLLIACANVANLLLVRAQASERARAVRLALGAGRARLMRYALVESLVLSLVGGAAGVVLAFLGTQMLIAAAPPIIPRLDHVGIDGRVLAFTLFVSVAVGVGAGLVSAKRSSTTAGAPREGRIGATREQRRTADALVLGQVALALVLLTAAALLTRSFTALRAVDPGFDSADLLTFRVSLTPPKYRDDASQARLYEQLVERLEDLPGVTSAAAVTDLPLTGGGQIQATRLEDRPTPVGEFPPTFHMLRVTPAYFATMGIPVLSGRALTAADEGSGVVVVSASVERRHWANQSALGRRITAGGVAARVVGVVGDVHYGALDAEPEPVVYWPVVDAAAAVPNSMALVVRGLGDPAMLLDDVRGTIADLDPDLPLSEVRTMDVIVARASSRTSFTMSLLVLAALVASGLAAIGIYGVLSKLASQRSGEIGLRVALGATAGDIRGMIMWRGMSLAGLGCALGLIASLPVGSLLESFLFRVDPLSVTTLASVVTTFLLAAAVSSHIPAKRAARLRPADVLRAE
jgi:predicted permease